MQENREIKALLLLIDDPDEEVFNVVSGKIMGYGTGIIPNLENLWENTTQEDTQDRIEMLIHRLHFHDLQEEFINWKKSPYQDLLSACVLVARFQYPDLVSTSIMQEMEKLRRNIWLELNSYLTPLEQVNVISSILYNYYGLKGMEVGYQHPEEFLVNKVLECKRGNTISNGILYLVLSQLLDIPVKAINIPKQFVLAYFKTDYSLDPKQSPQQQIEFYIDPLSGQVFTHKDVENYFKRISVPPVASYFKAVDQKRIVQTLLEEFSKCFDSAKNEYKQRELLQLAGIVASSEQ
jgi:regulator of sirC expression with transglutaminase-like and TPR domain